MGNIKHNLTDKQIKELAREKRNEYQRNWRRNNPEKVKENISNYWKRQALKDLEEKEG